MATKDYIKFRNSVKSDTNLSLEEAYMLETLFDYYNSKLGYAYPSYEILMKDLKTKRRAKISKLLKALVAKGYIQIGKKYKNNIYKIKKYLYITIETEQKKENKGPVDSNGDKPLDGQVHIDESITVIVNETGFSEKEAKDLLNESGENITKVIDAFKYAATKNNINNMFQYTKWVIKNNIKKVITGTKKKEIPFVEYCSKRKYSDEEYKDIEWRMLGWV